MQNRARKPPQTVHYNVDKEHPLLQQTHRLQYKWMTTPPTLQIIYQHIQFTHPSVTPQTSPIEQQSPIRMQTNLLSQNSIAAPEATMPNTPDEKIPKSLNGEGVKNGRKQVATSTTNAQGSRLCFRYKQLGHLKKDFPELPYCSKRRT